MFILIGDKYFGKKIDSTQCFWIKKMQTAGILWCAIKLLLHFFYSLDLSIEFKETEIVAV